MNPLFRLGPIFLTVVLGGCAYIGESPAPTAESSSIPLAEVTSSPRPPTLKASLATPTEPPAATPSAIPTAEPPPNVEPSPTAEPPGGVWRRVSDFPPEGAVITAMAWDGSRFVAAGTIPIDPSRCDDGFDGRIWTSADGRTWSDPFALPDLAPFEVVVAGGVAYVFAQGGNYCDYSERTHVWRASGPNHWDLARRAIEGDGEEYLSAVGAIEDRLIALGESWTHDGHLNGVVRWSTDGSTWTRINDGPLANLDSFSDVIALGNIAVALDTYSTRPISVSTDGGFRWREADYAPIAFVQPFQAVASNGQIVAIGSACCTMPDVDAGVTLRSTDGLGWEESAAFALEPRAITSLPDGFLAVSEETWFSADGLDWHLAAPLPRFAEQTGTTALAAGDVALVTNGRFAWTASVAELMASIGSDRPALAARPEVGVSYSANLFTHCGWPETHFDLRTWIPDPPIDDINPPQGIKETDHGEFTLVGENRLQYQAERGRVVDLVPSDVGLISGPCA